MTAHTSTPAASRLLDRIAHARLQLEAWTQQGRHPAVLAATLVAALLVTGGLAQLMLDDSRVELALPEPPKPSQLAQPTQVGQASLGLPSDAAPLLAQVRGH